MNYLKAFALSSFMFAACAIAATDADTDDRIDLTVKNLAEAQMRVLGKASSFCAAIRQSDERLFDVRLRSYVDAFSMGTKAAMIEIAKTDKEFVNSSPPIGPRELVAPEEPPQPA